MHDCVMPEAIQTASFLLGMWARHLILRTMRDNTEAFLENNSPYVDPCLAAIAQCRALDTT